MVFIVLFCTYINKLYYYFNVLLNSCENKFFSLNALLIASFKPTASWLNSGVAILKKVC